MSALVWLTWRQHRWTIISTTVVAVLAAYGLLSTDMSYNMGTSLPLGGFYGLIVQVLFGAVIGMFWGAPLIARELEERTYFVAWGQDVTPDRWLRGKLVVLGGAAIVLALLVGVGDGYRGDQSQTWQMFEASAIVQIGYVLLGLGIGVLAGLLTRHTITAMAATLVFYAIIRAVLAIAVRDHYLPSRRSIARWDQTASVPGDSLTVGSGYIDTNLKPVSLTERCEGEPSPGSCMRIDGAAAGTYVDYQPIERLEVFRVMEFAVCVLIAAAALYLTFRLLRNGGGWRPSRSHRRDVAAVQSTPATAEAHAEG